MILTLLLKKLARADLRTSVIESAEAEPASRFGTEDALILVLPIQLSGEDGERCFVIESRAAVRSARPNLEQEGGCVNNEAFPAMVGYEN
jgi:hypothetical protein